MKKLFLLLFLGAFVFSFTACNGSTKTDDAKKIEKTENSGPEYTSKYVCPMHCEGSGSAIAGTCPKCNMDYELNPNFKDESHEGHDHGDHEGHDH